MYLLMKANESTMAALLAGWLAGWWLMAATEEGKQGARKGRLEFDIMGHFEWWG